MNTAILQKIEQKTLKQDLPNMKVGDTIEVSVVIREGDKERIQKFKGLVIATKGSGMSATFTVRKISFGVGVERIFPLHSPSVKDIKIIKSGKVRRSKIYYMRTRQGRSAMKVKSGEPLMVVEGKEEESTEEVATA